MIPDIAVHDTDKVRFLFNEDPVSLVAGMSAPGMGQGSGFSHTGLADAIGRHGAKP